MAIQWSLVVFSLLAGCAAGSLVFIGLAEITGTAKKAGFPISIIAGILLLLGGIASVTHLGNPVNVMSAVTNIFSFSGISLELLFLGLSLLVAIIYAIASRRESALGTRIVGIIGLVLGLILCVVLGSSYLIAARPAWNNFGLPLSFFGSSLVMGGFLFVTVANSVKVDKEDIKMTCVWIIVAAIIALVAYLAFGLLSGVALDPAQAALFWVAVVIIGAGIPTVCAIMLHANTGRKSLAYIGLVSAVIGGVGFRALMWVAGSGVLDIFGAANSVLPF